MEGYVWSVEVNSCGAVYNVLLTHFVTLTSRGFTLAALRLTRHTLLPSPHSFQAHNHLHHLAQHFSSHLTPSLSHTHGYHPIFLTPSLFVCSEELGGLLRGLGGGWVPPEAGGDLLRDGPGVLPTGEGGQQEGCGADSTIHITGPVDSAASLVVTVANLSALDEGVNDLTAWQVGLQVQSY